MQREPSALNHRISALDWRAEANEADVKLDASSPRLLYYSTCPLQLIPVLLTCFIVQSSLGSEDGEQGLLNSFRHLSRGAAREEYELHARRTRGE